ncbi:MAG: thioredoxin family protein [Planctomycetota bacterium]
MPTVEVPAASAPFLTLDQFAAALSDTEDVVLVEFCMPSGCSRCDAMRGPIDRLANDRRDGMAVRRVNLRQHPQLTWEFKLNACPSYVAFRGGQEVFRAEHPTSADLIAAQLDESFGDLAPQPLAAVTR